jgi:hypothetical protein
VDYRKIDSLVAEKVMGWHNFFNPRNGKETWWVQVEGGTYQHVKENFNPSTNISDAWQVVEKLRNEHELEVIIETRECQTEVKAKGRLGGWISDLYGIAETAPLAICLASLKAKGIDIDAK